MARINIETDLFNDNRFLYIIEKIGQIKAIGYYVLLAKIAQKYYVNDQLIPEIEIKILNLPDVFFETEIIRTAANENEHNKKEYEFYNNSQFDWLKQKKIAGQKSGAARRKKVVNNKKHVNENERRSTESNGGEPLTLTLTHTLTHNNICKKQIYSEVITFLNETTGSRIDPNGTSHRKIIDYWVSKKYTADDFKHIIKVKHAEWRDNPKMAKFTKRPQTLFGKSHFEDYLSQELETDVESDVFDYLTKIQGEMNND